jgi:hypothetical protein
VRLLERRPDVPHALRHQEEVALLLGLLAGCAGPAPAPATPVVQVDGVRAPVRAATEERPVVDPTPEAIAWRTSFDEAAAEAETEGRALLVFCHAAWQVHSLAMARDVWADPRIRRAARTVVPVFLDLTSSDETAPAAQAAVRLGLTLVPSVALLTSDRREIGRLEGVADADAVLELLRRVP